VRETAPSSCLMTYLTEWTCDIDALYRSQKFMKQVVGILWAWQEEWQGRIKLNTKVASLPPFSDIISIETNIQSSHPLHISRNPANLKKSKCSNSRSSAS